MLQLVLAGGLSGRDMGNTNLKSAICGHVLFGSTWEIASLVCKGAQTSHLHTRADSGKFSATRATWFVWYTNSMMQLVLAGGLSGRDMGNTNLKSALCGHVLFGSTWK